MIPEDLDFAHLLKRIRLEFRIFLIDSDVRMDFLIRLFRRSLCTQTNECRKWLDLSTMCARCTDNGNRAGACIIGELIRFKDEPEWFSVSSSNGFSDLSDCKQLPC